MFLLAPNTRGRHRRISIPVIVSKLRRFIFLKTSKTAGTSLEIALSKHASRDDIITPISPEDENMRRALGYAGPQNYLAPLGLMQILCLKRQARRFHNHMQAHAIRDVLGQETFDSFLKVAVVRNPFDMVVSRYFWAHRREGHCSHEHFRQWLLSFPASLYKNQAITHINGRSTVDFTIRFERFEEDLKVFARKVRLPDTLYQDFCAIKTKTKYRPKTSTTEAMFEGFEEGKAVVSSIFAEDIAAHGYQCPGQPARVKWLASLVAHIATSVAALQMMDGVLLIA